MAFDIKKTMNAIGLPRIIIATFFVFIWITAFFLKQPMDMLASDTLRRVGMNLILVLAMVPSIKSGTGPNFALPVGISCGLLGLVMSIEFGFKGAACLIAAILLSLIFAAIVGFAYGKLLNTVRGAEMTIATYTGFSIVAFMCLIWLMVPFKSPNMGWFIGEGLRETIQLDAVGCAQIINNFLSFQIGGVIVPTGLILVFSVACLIVWLFFRTKVGIAITAGGSNPKFAMASGININNARIFANMLSTMLAAVGIIIYSQSFGYMQLYLAPLRMAFPAVAAILIGGATAAKAKVSHVLIGTFLFQGLMTSALPVANQIFAGMDLSEIMRIIIQNGIILYALTQVKEG